MPEPKATWYKADKVIKAGRKYVIETTSETATLKIPKPTTADSASYTLKLENSAGKDSATIKVEIKGGYWECRHEYNFNGGGGIMFEQLSILKCYN